MYQVRPHKVYVHQRVLSQPACVVRMERMMTAIEPDEPPVVVDDAALNEISEAERWGRVPEWRAGQYRRARDPDIVFTTYTWEPAAAITARRQRYPHLGFGLLAGAGMVGYRDGRSLLEKRHGVCQNAYDLHSAWGCLHACDYCNIGEFLTIILNLEEMVARLDETLDAHPWCRLYKHDNQTDTITFEPECGASALLVQYFAGREDQYLMLYTKSDNVDHLLELDHRGHTSLSFTISCQTVARESEKNSPSTSARIEAARKCQQAGYHVRVRFSPIVPIKGWRVENLAMLEELLGQVHPDVITMDVLALLGYDRLVGCFDSPLLEEGYVKMARQLHCGEPPGKPFWPAGKQMFPHQARAEIYRHFLRHIRRLDPQVPVALCDETPERWDEFGAVMTAGTPQDYVCACGPTSVPGNPLLRTVV